MLKNLNVQHKIYAVIGASVLLMILAYLLSFAETLALRKEVKQKQAILMNLDDVKQEIAGYEQALENNSLNLKTDKNALQNMILNQVTEFCENSGGANKLSISEFLPIHAYQLEEKTIHTCSFSVRGSFTELLKLNKELEENLINAELSSVEYTLKKKRKKKELTATYHVQNISEL